MSLHSWLWLVATGVTVLGAALLAVGLRGRRVNNHPVCRKCGFDLVGREDLDQTWGDAICSECGADLKRRRAIVPGQRAPRRTPRAVGILLVVLGFGMQGALMWATAVRLDWNTVKPVWLLMREAQSSDPGASLLAIAELRRRHDVAPLPDQALVELACFALREQADANRDEPALRSRVKEAMRFFEDAAIAGLTTQQEIEAYLSPLEVAAEHRSRATREEWLPLFSHAVSRVGLLPHSKLAVRTQLRTAYLGSTELEIDSDVREPRGLGGDWWTDHVKIGADPGEYWLRLEWELLVIAAESSRPLTRFAASQREPLTVLDEVESPIELVSEDSDTLGGRLRVWIDLSRSPALIQVDGDVPVSIAGEWFLQVGDRVLELGRHSFEAADSWRMAAWRCRAPDWLTPAVQAEAVVIVRPDAEWAVQRTPFDSICGEEIEIRSIRISQ